MLITLEGGEGSGKSTQMKVLYGRLCQAGYSTKIVREPGGTALGELIRYLFSLPRGLEAWLRWEQAYLQPDSPMSGQAPPDIWVRMVPQAELHLFLASRAQLVSEVMRPALARGSIVVCDRFIHSTLAYQGYGQGMDFQLLKSFNRHVTGGLEPDVVVLLDVDPSKGLARKGNGLTVNRFELEGIDFFRRVRQGYLEMASQEPERWIVVDTSLPRTEVTRRIWQELAHRLPAKARPKSTVASSGESRRLL